VAQIKPFRGVRYNSEKISDISQVVCPPYDVISPADQARYHSLNPYNYIRIVLGVSKNGDDRYDNKYTRARKSFEEWLKKGVLVEDAKPCIYFYRQEYLLRGQKYSRTGFIALMRLQDKGDSKIYPHENTQAKAKEDRLKLWRHLKINCSPIFVCFADKEKRVEKIFIESVLPAKPFIDITDIENIRHTLWRLEDSKLIEGIKDAVAPQALFIADGHHRYEVALELRRSMLAKKKRSSGQEPCNYVMTYFTNLDSRDLLILPIHRVIRKLRHKMNFLEEYFRIDRISSKEELQIMLAKAGQNENAFGLYTKDGIRLLRLKNKMLIDQHIRQGSRDLRSLDANILKHFILDRLGITHEEIVYVKDLNEAFGMIDSEEAQATFIMNPVRVQQLKNVALGGERMPPKTTYFYPKALSGLTIYRLNP